MCNWPNGSLCIHSHFYDPSIYQSMFLEQRSVANWCDSLIHHVGLENSLSMHNNSCLSAIHELDIWAGPLPVVLVGVIVVEVFSRVLGGKVTHQVGSVSWLIDVIIGGCISVGVGAGGGFCFTLDYCCSGHSSAFFCLCTRPCFHSCCIVPACLDLYRLLLASGSGSHLPALAQARNFIAITEIPITHSMSSLWFASHFVSLSFSYVFMPSYSVSSHAIWVSRYLPFLWTPLFHGATAYNCCIIKFSISLLQSHSVLSDSGIPRIYYFPCIFCLPLHACSHECAACYVLRQFISYAAGLFSY